jgi:long-chain acyl-CoA synthetase
MDFRRLFDILPYQYAKYPKKVALAESVNHQWKTYTSSECLRQVNQISAGLLSLGLKKGDKAAILAHHGSATWCFIDLAMQQIGIVVVPIHGVIASDDLIFILKDAEIKLCLTDGPELFLKAQQAQTQAPVLKHLFTFHPHPNIPSLQELQIAPEEKHLAQFQTYKAVIHEDDLATIIYTSGTTGRPKGVMLSHKNIVSNIKSVIALIPINHGHVSVSYLPLSHIFERMVVYTYMAVGASLYFSGGSDHLLRVMQEVHPHYLTTVPRLLEKLHERFAQEALRQKGLRRRGLQWAIRVGKKFGRQKGVGLKLWIQLRLADILVYRRWRRLFGNRLQGLIVGAAALQEDLARLFSAAGIDIREGYGLTETSPVVAFNRFEPGLWQFGTVGIPVPGVDVKIDQPNEDGDGEILVKGPNVMLGYLNRPEETASVFTEDGWFRTGDIGTFINRRFLKITDRSKAIFKTSSGRYVAPQPIERELQSSPFIDHALVIGFQRPHLVALILPSFPMLEAWCEEHNVHWTAPPYMVLNPKVEKLYRQIIDRINDGLAKHEKIRDILLIHEDFTVEEGQITPTQKLKRAAVEHLYQSQIDKLYD